MQTLIRLDTDLLLLLNGLHTPWLDSFMSLISGGMAWLIPGVVTLVYLLYRKGWEEVAILLLAIGLCILLSDQMASGVAKPLVQRLRPTHTPELAELLHVVNGYRGGLYGFFSSHAANFSSVGLLLCLVIRRRMHLFVWLVLILVVSLSRVYLGVHYPTDILVGMAWGAVVALGVYRWCYEPMRRRLSRQGHLPAREVFAPGQWWYLCTLYLFLPSLIVYSLLITYL